MQYKKLFNFMGVLIKIQTGIEFWGLQIFFRFFPSYKSMHEQNVFHDDRCAAMF